MRIQRRLRAFMRYSVLAGALAAAVGGAEALGAVRAGRDFGSGSAGAGWHGSRFVYVSNGSSLADTLNLFGADQNVPVSINGSVTGIVRGRFAMAPQQFLDMLCASFGLVWYYDGAVIQISPASDQQSLTMRPNYLSPQALAAALDHAGISDRHFPLRIDAGYGTLSVTGPASYVERIRGAAQRFELGAQARVRTGAKILRLTSASAADQVRVIDGRQLVVPGAASLLARRFQQTRHDPDGVRVVEFAAPLPIIEADAATNSILIRDKSERIDGDAMQVADFDTAPQVVTVQTWVIDVDRDALAELGAALPASESSIVAEGGGDLFARLHALEQVHRAHTEVWRTAVTFDRAPAVIDRHQARLAQSVGLVPADTADLWLAIEPTLDADPMVQRIGLRVDLGPTGTPPADQPGQRPRERIVEATVAAGACLVIAAPSSGTADQMGPVNPADAADAANPVNTVPRQRLVLLIPRLAT